MTASDSSSGPTPLRQAQLLQNLRYRRTSALLAQMMRDTPLRIMLVVGLTAVFWSLMLVLFREGFLLLRDTVIHEPTMIRTAHAIFNVFFSAMLIMLAMSGGILYFAALFRSEETRYLLTLPVHEQPIARDRFLEATWLACWGFLLLGTPMLLAYGQVHDCAAAYYVFMFPMLLSFALIAAGLGAIACLLLVRLPAEIRFWGLRLFGVAVALVFAWFVWSLLRSTEQTPISMLWFQSLLDRVRATEQRWLPSWWLSTGLMELAHGGPRGTIEACGFQCVLLSNALVFSQLVSALGGKTLRKCYSASAAGPARSAHKRQVRVPTFFHRLTNWLLWPIPVSLRTIVTKDLTIFRRDPLQWSQFLLFFGLLTFYFVYVRRFDQSQAMAAWMTLIGFMNLAVVGLILSTFTTRFVYPLVSIEGQRFWILGTAPLSRRSVLWSKFLFSSAITVVPCCVLVFLSDIALKLWTLTPGLVVLHQLLCAEIGIGLASLAVGLGARWPNLREPSAAKIAAGFGGTLNLIVSAIFVAALILPVAIPAYFHYAATDVTTVVSAPQFAAPYRWLIIGTFTTGLLTAATATYALRVGLVAFDALET